MGRSVSVPSNAVAVAYIDWREYIGCEDPMDDDPFWWDDFSEDIIARLQGKLPSLKSCDEWLDREDHAVLENRHCYITISEYCGLVAVALVAKDTANWPDDTQGLTDHWCDQVSGHIESLGTLRHIGTASNGEAFFRRVA